MAHRFEDLRVWQEARKLAVSLYTLTSKFPSEEKFQLTSQIRRAAVSIAANITEGSRRRTNKDFAHFLNMAEGSAGEVECLLLIGQDLGYVSGEDAKKYVGELKEIYSMLHAFRMKLESEG